MIDQVRELVVDVDRLLDRLRAAKGGTEEEITALRLETCRRRLQSVRNVLALELHDQELERGDGVLVQVQRDDYQRRRP